MNPCLCKINNLQINKGLASRQIRRIRKDSSLYLPFVSLSEKCMTKASYSIPNYRK